MGNRECRVQELALTPVLNALGGQQTRTEKRMHEAASSHRLSVYPRVMMYRGFLLGWRNPPTEAIRVLHNDAMQSFGVVNDQNLCLDERSQQS